MSFPKTRWLLSGLGVIAAAGVVVTLVRRTLIDVPPTDELAPKPSVAVGDSLRALG
jgi:hypothetical protein